ncbi:uncharacterized protein LOC135331162 isoform X2 [Halichondria panicea]|uniref:uncharacterized protein LOC135331162 isoform X2 n=1 Tax=Halichondria panicea TaxID=6063 RepID=UPI00312B9319
MKAALKLQLVFILQAVFFCLCSGQLSAIVSFNGRGITGNITFTEVLDPPSIRITTDLDGLRGSHGWHVHTLPVDQTAYPTVQCLSTMTGPHYDPFNANNDSNYNTRCTPNSPQLCELGDLFGKFGPIPAGGMLTGVDSTGLALEGRYSIVGRSVVIHHHLDSSNFECGTIRYMDEQSDMVTTLQARLISPVAGTIYLRQMTGRNVAIWGKLFWINDRNSSVDHNWHIHETAPGEEYRIGMCNTTGNVGPHFDFNSNYTQDCTPASPGACEIGDLTGKHDRVIVAANPSPFAANSFFYTDTTVVLTNVTNRSIAIHMENRGVPVVACAPLVQSEELVLFSYTDGVLTSDFRVAQVSAFEDTIIYQSFGSELSNISVLRSALNPLTNCFADEEVYSPYPVVAAEGGRTPDMYALGAWGERYLYDLTKLSTIAVFDVPVHGGNNSVSGKSVRQIFETNSRVCSALLPRLDDQVIMAKAMFNGLINGAIYLIQENFGFDQLGNTHIIVDIYYAAPSMMTSGHNWHIHEHPTQQEQDVDCVDTIGGHYNPFNVSLANTNDGMSPSQFSNYSDDCSVRYNLRCESGDLSGKHGKLSISSDVKSRPVVSFVDSNLALTGSFSVIGRSIGLHSSEGPLFDCGNVQRSYISSTVVSIRMDANRMLSAFSFESKYHNRI